MPPSQVNNNLSRRPARCLRYAPAILLSQLVLVLLRFSHPALTAASASASPEERGMALAIQLREQQPPEEFTTSGLLRRRDANGRWLSSVPVRFAVRLNPDSWQSIYQALGPGDKPVEVLVVTHRSSLPNRYNHSRASDSALLENNLVTLQGDAAAIPFAGSEFWLSDLGLEFLHWPGQRTIGNQMRKGRACHILESINPAPATGAYARVLSWIDVEHCGLLRAEAYDSDHKLMKEFNIGSFKKIDGKWQLKSMEIRNERTDARTRLEFELEIEQR